MKTNCNTLLDLIYSYRVERYFKALFEGIERFREKKIIWDLCHLL
jgi:hypothetical protein